MKRDDQPSLIRLYLPYMCIVLTVITTLWISSVYRAHGHWRQAESLYQQGAFMRAARHYQWAARSYYPGSNIGEQSLSQLWALAQRLHQQGHIDEGLMCLDLLRGAIWSTRWLMQPYGLWRERVDQALLDLRGKEVNRERLALALQYDPFPSVAQSLCLLLSICAFLTSIGHFLRKGLTQDLALTSHTVWALATVLATLLCIFISLVP